MDYSSWIFTLVLLMVYSQRGYAEDQKLEQPSNVTLDMWDGEVTLVWAPPAKAWSQFRYNVQVAEYNGKLLWIPVRHCNGTLSTRCDLTDVTNSINHYWARVQTVKEESTSDWLKYRKKFTKKNSKVRPPTFTLSTTPTSVKVRVHRKPALMVTFSHGIKYTYHLQEKGQDNVVHKSVLWVGDEEKEEKDVELEYLTGGREYCVRLDMEDTSGTFKSGTSSEQCIILPEPGKWLRLMVIGLALISLMGLLGLMGLLLNCFLRRPEKLPSTLKSSGSSWNPLSLREVPVEVVMNKGWLLISRNTQGKGGVMGEKMKLRDKEEGQDRRGSLDSGMSMDQALAETGRGGAGEGGGGKSCKLDDSGCGSLGESDGDIGGSRQPSEELPVLDGRNDGHGSPQKEDSGMGQGCQYSGPRSLQGEDCGHLLHKVAATGDAYRSQRPSFVVVQDSEREEASEIATNDTDNSIANVVGYRPSQLSCVCLGKGLCFWCQSTAPLPTKEHSMCSYPATDTSDQFPASSIICFSDSYLKKGNFQTWEDLEQRESPFICHIQQTESSESAPLLISVPQLPLLCGGLDSNVNALSLSLQDVELTFD
ncbi:hypothetical protein AAFF_G00345860 [Aldrovandia affinis]|uniref:Fibronectin type-III domain-containing protein n=1 Tax=Aldrovandia affinis TaxID=143900 RepID=A0AAD7SJK7_9TELE|nr:hypothetical protein AAFF_G00345860 [Aldrovandia affinis]